MIILLPDWRRRRTRTARGRAAEHHQSRNGPAWLPPFLGAEGADHVRTCENFILIPLRLRKCEVGHTYLAASASTSVAASSKASSTGPRMPQRPSTIIRHHLTEHFS